MSLVGAELQPLEQKAVHLPLPVDFRHPAAPLTDRMLARTASPAVTEQLRRPHVMVDADPRIGLAHRTLRGLEQVGQIQDRGVVVALDYGEVEVERPRHAGDHRPVEVVELGHESGEADVVGLVQSDKGGKIPRFLESRQPFVCQPDHAGILQISGGMKSPAGADDQGPDGRQGVLLRLWR